MVIVFVAGMAMLSTIAFVTVALIDPWRPSHGKLFVVTLATLANIFFAMALLYLLIFHQ